MMKIKISFRLAVLMMFFVLALSGCSTAKKAMVPEIKQLEMLPVQMNSKYSSALDRLGVLMETINERPIMVSVPPVINQTGGEGQGVLPQDITVMVEAALQNIGETVIVSPYGGSVSLPLTELDATSGIYNIHGAITEFDAATTSTSSGGQVGLSFNDILDVSAESDTEISSGTIAMNFMVLDRRRGVYVSGVKAAVKMTFSKQTEGQGYSFALVGNGFGLRGSATTKTPIHHMINILVEYSVVQLIGRLKEYPYWLVIKGAAPDYRYIAKMKRSFNKQSEERKNAMVTFIMSTIDQSVEVSRVIDSRTREKIKYLKVKLGVVPANGKVTERFYIKLLTNSTKLLQQRDSLRNADGVLDSILE